MAGAERAGRGVSEAHADAENQVLMKRLRVPPKPGLPGEPVHQNWVAARGEP